MRTLKAAKKVTRRSQVVAFIAAFALLMLSVPHVASAGPFTFTTIALPGSLGTHAYGINDHGQIVGTYFGVDRKLHGFLLSGGGLH